MIKKSQSFLRGSGYLEIEIKYRLDARTENNEVVN